MAKTKRGALHLLTSADFTFAAGGRQDKVIDLPAALIQNIYIWVRGNLTKTGVTVPGNVHRDGAAQVLRFIDARLGGIPWKKGSGAAFHRAAQKLAQTAGINQGILDGAAGTDEFEVMFPLFAGMPSTVNPADAWIDGQRHKKLQLGLTYGEVTDILVGATGTYALTNVTIEVVAEFTDATKGAKSGGWGFRQSEQEFDIAATSSAKPFVLDVEEDAIYAGLLLRTVDGSDLSDEILNRLTLVVNGGDEIPVRSLEDDFIQAKALYDYGVDIDPEGWYYINLHENGRVLTTGLGAGAEKVLSLTLDGDVTVGSGATKLVVHTLRMVPPKQFRAAA